MGVMSGYEQKQVYVEDGLWPLIVMLAKKLGVPTYKLVNDGLKDLLSAHFTPAEQKTIQSMLSNAVERHDEHEHKMNSKKEKKRNGHREGRKSR